LLKDRTYDVILANINRNILLNDIPVLAKCLTKEGFLFLSGFYEQDIEIISELCNKCGLECVDMIKRNQWVALKFKS
ncbi:MAG: 50S ribosomal protein L11 methyltransferase, partial [Flavobacteriaceae bacterium]|nr:50S ribosomal protein L11 methyltransferase [Flavobacteriaceae bacterium]